MHTVHVRMYTHQTWTHAHTCTYVCIPTMHERIYTHQTWTHAHTCMYVCMHTVHVRMYTHQTWTHAHTCTYVCIYTMHGRMHTHIHVRMYTHHAELAVPRKQVLVDGKGARSPRTCTTEEQACALLLHVLLGCSNVEHEANMDRLRFSCPELLK
jgi:hypothetical protein